jgi:hypothetical protein
MELTTIDRKPVRRAFKSEPKVTTGIDAMAAIELEINRLKRLFSVAGCTGFITFLEHTCSIEN